MIKILTRFLCLTLLFNAFQLHSQASCTLEKEQMKDILNSDRFQENPTAFGVIKQKEISGIDYAFKYPAHFWGVNDSGDGPVLYLYSSQNGALRKIFILNGLTNIDWEDITMGYGLDGSQGLFIGDIGDNQSKRNTYTIYWISEPDTSSLGARIETLSIEPDKLKFQYEDGARDAEALSYDPIQKRLIVTTKRESFVGVYQIPVQPTNELIVAEKLGTLPFSNVVASDFSEDGMQFIVKTYTDVFLWKRQSTNQTFCEMISSTPTRLPYALEPQGESICFIPGGYITLSEERFNIQPRLYLYQEKK